jgi:hypothetical protein
MNAAVSALNAAPRATDLAAASGHLNALDTSQVRNLGLGSIAVVVLVGLLIAYFVTRVVTKIIVLAIVVVLGLGLYQQRARVLAAIDKTAKNCNVTFFGVHVQPSDPTIKQACAEVAKQRGK